MGRRRERDKFEVPESIPLVDPAEIFRFGSDGQDAALLFIPRVVAPKTEFRGSVDLVRHAAACCADVIEAAANRESLHDSTGSGYSTSDGWVYRACNSGEMSFMRPGGWCEMLSRDSEILERQPIRHRKTLSVDHLVSHNYHRQAIGLSFYCSLHPDRPVAYHRPNRSRSLQKGDLEQIHRVLTIDNALEVARLLRSFSRK